MVNRDRKGANKDQRGPLVEKLESPDSHPSKTVRAVQPVKTGPLPASALVAPLHSVDRNGKRLWAVPLQVAVSILQMENGKRRMGKRERGTQEGR